MALNRLWVATLGALVLGSQALLGQSGESQSKPGIRKLECRKVEAEASIRIAAFDLAGRPAEGLWVDAVSKAYGREQTVQVNPDGVAKLWVRRDRPYEISAYGCQFASDLVLPEVRVPLDCELQVHVTVERRSEKCAIIYVSDEAAEQGAAPGEARKEDAQ
jgi:hypothetical protein